MKKKIDESFLTERRIYVVVTPVVHVAGIGKVELEVGRMAAQACHAVSRLKLWFAELQENLGWVKVLVETPITTIVLKARDQRELEHVALLVEKAALTYTTFSDTNPSFYKAPEEMLTAIAIGPVKKTEIEGICDYLPLL